MQCWTATVTRTATKSIALLAKNKFARAAPLFCRVLCRCFAGPWCRFGRLEEELPYVLTKNFVACVRGRMYFFFHYRSFSPCWPLLADREHFSFSYRRYEIFMFFFFATKFVTFFLGVDHLVFDGAGCRIFRLLDIFFIAPALQDFFFNLPVLAWYFF